MADQEDSNEKKNILLVTLGIVIAAFLNGQGLDEDEEGKDHETHTR